MIKNIIDIWKKKSNGQNIRKVLNFLVERIKIYYYLYILRNSVPFSLLDLIYVYKNEINWLFQWGSSRYGQLGHGSNNTEHQPKKILELMGTKVTQVFYFYFDWSINMFTI